MFRISKFVNYSLIKKSINKNIKFFSTNEKIFVSLLKSKNSLPQLNPLELALKSLTSFFLAPFGICTVKQNHILTYYTFGKYDGYRTNGLTWIPPFF